MGVCYGRVERELVRHILFVWHGVAKKKRCWEEVIAKKQYNSLSVDGEVLVMVDWLCLMCAVYCMHWGSML